MAMRQQAGRVNQKARTRMAIVSAARELIQTGQPVTMPAVAQAALVSEPTAYRYFPDLLSLLTEAFAGLWPDPEQALRPVAVSRTPPSGLRMRPSSCSGTCWPTRGRYAP